jgi:hypothetical protein
VAPTKNEIYIPTKANQMKKKLTIIHEINAALRTQLVLLLFYMKINSSLREREGFENTP